MAALYDGDDNRVFTASRKDGKNTYQLFRRQEKEQKTTNGRKSPKMSPNGEENSLFWYGFSQNVLKSTAYVAGEFLSVNDVYRVVTGRDPLTGEKYSDMHQKYMDGHISKEEFLEWYRDPKNYRPELPSTNRSHKYE